MTNRQTVATRKASSPLQRDLRRRSSRLEFSVAVRMAADALFGFTHRAKDAKALWSNTGVVWLGRGTFLDWALDDTEMDIPWVVAKAVDAPKGVDQRRLAVKSELADYWLDRLSALPRMSRGNWLPLP